jgi:murein DD-endopeptidase MepM/ murein hydrolase activator NlpD
MHCSILVVPTREHGARMLTRNLLFVLFLSVSPPLAAEESCAAGMGTVRLDAVQRENSVTISAHNQETYEVTVTVNANLKNMTPSATLPHTRTLDGGFRGLILTLQAAPRGEWQWQYSFHWTPGSINARHDDSVVYDLPYKGTHTVIQGFRGTFSHTGDFEYAVDWEMPVNTAVYAAREGVVAGTRSKMNQGGPDKKYKQLANFVMIRHKDGTIGSYDHLKENGVTVSVGDQVRRGQLIGYSGITGFTTRPHLHFVVFRAKDGFTRESFAMRFRTAAGIVSPVEGRSYTSGQ